MMFVKLFSLWAHAVGPASLRRHRRLCDVVSAACAHRGIFVPTLNKDTTTTTTTGKGCIGYF